MRNALKSLAVGLALSVGISAAHGQQSAQKAETPAPVAPQAPSALTPPSGPAPKPAAAPATTPKPPVRPAAETKSKDLPNGADRRTVAAQAVSVGKSCFRMTLSDIQVGREETVASARKKLAEEYAPETARQRGLKGRLGSPANEVIRCENYLWLPILGQEYKCFVTATFCAR